MDTAAQPDVVATRGAVSLRTAREADLPAVDGLTVTCYAAIRDLYAEHPDRVWVLDGNGDVFGFVTFWLFPEHGYGHLDNNGVRPDRAGEGWATFVYRHVLERFRALGLRYAHVDTGLDDAHIPARRAYEAVGFDRPVPGWSTGRTSAPAIPVRRPRHPAVRGRVSPCAPRGTEPWCARGSQPRM